MTNGIRQLGTCCTGDVNHKPPCITFVEYIVSNGPINVFLGNLPAENNVTKLYGINTGACKSKKTNLLKRFNVGPHLFPWGKLSGDKWSYSGQDNFPYISI